jgi:subtilisin family serine protease
MSWGTYNYSDALHEAVQYAYNNGVLLVASAGNDASSTPRYPAAYPEVIAVSATYENDAFASWWGVDQYGNPIGSNFGSWIELSAPGVNITTTAYGSTYVHNRNGTSYSAPYVAGVAALVWSKYPNLTRDELRLHLRYTAKDLGSPGFDIHYGYGRVDAKNAVETVPVLHDLSVSLESPAQVTQGQTALLNATVYNAGLNNETSVTLYVLINGSVVSSATIDSLPSHSSYTLSYSWAPTTTGTYNITAYTTPKPTEENTNNNIVTKYIQVISPPTGGGDKALPDSDEAIPTDEQNQQT